MKTMLIILLACLSCKAWAQYESVFGDSSTSWNLLYEGGDVFDTDSLATLNDTLIDTLEYKTIKVYTLVVDGENSGSKQIVLTK